MLVTEEEERGSVPSFSEVQPYHCLCREKHQVFVMTFNKFFRFELGVMVSGSERRTGPDVTVESQCRKKTKKFVRSNTLSSCQNRTED